MAIVYKENSNPSAAGRKAPGFYFLRKQIPILHLAPVHADVLEFQKPVQAVYSEIVIE